MTASEPTNIGLSEEAHVLLKQMKEDGQVAEMQHAYRLAIALALAQGASPPEVPTPRATIFGVATIDPDQSLAAAIRALVDIGEGSVYKMAERLADHGVREMERRFAGGDLDVGALIDEAKAEGQKVA